MSLTEWRSHPFLRSSFATADIAADWVSDNGDAYVAVITGADQSAEPDPDRRDLVVLGAPGADQAVAELLTRVVASGEVSGPFEGVDAPETALALVSDELLESLGYSDDHGGWYYLYTEQRLPVPEIADTIERVPPGPAIAAEVRALLDVAYPEAWTPTDSPKMVAWWTVRREGELVAAIGATQNEPNAVPWLCSLAVSPQARGTGLGSALLLTAGNECLELPMTGSPLVSLGVYRYNTKAAELYARLGWTPATTFTSW